MKVISYEVEEMVNFRNGYRVRVSFEKPETDCDYGPYVSLQLESRQWCSGQCDGRWKPVNRDFSWMLGLPIRKRRVLKELELWLGNWPFNDIPSKESIPGKVVRAINKMSRQKCLFRLPALIIKE